MQPMTLWVMYLSLFDFVITMLPAEKHKPRMSVMEKCSLVTSEEDTEDYLDNYHRQHAAQLKKTLLSSPSPPPPLLTPMTCLHHRASQFSMTTLSTVPHTPYREYDMPTFHEHYIQNPLDKDIHC